MEINRRNFIQLLVGGVAGIHLTPLPWKLTDDIAIWTQNWPWVPVPRTGAFRNVKSICSICPGGCGIEVRKAGSRAVKIEGRTDFPVNPGGICPVGMGGLQLLYNESIRFPHPMKRVGPRGSGKFQDITWKEALQILASRINQHRKDGSPHTIAAVDGNPIDSTVSALIERLLKAIGSPNYMRVPTAEDTYRTASQIMMGSQYPMAYDFEKSDFILSFGSGLLEGWGSPGRILNAWGIWHDRDNRKKVQIVQVESRSSNTASKAGRWVACRPGKEAALALAMIHVLIKEGLYNKKFIREQTFGFEDFKSLVLSRYAPSQASSITGVSAKDIAALARNFARAKAPVALCGKGKGLLPGSVYEFMAVNALNAMVGNINRPGGMVVREPLPLSPLAGFSADPIAKEGLGHVLPDSKGRARKPFEGNYVGRLAESVLEGEGSPVKTLLVFSSNPAYTCPDGGAFKKALQKIPFIVSFSPYRDETSNMADLILPDHTYLEKQDDMIGAAGLQDLFYSLSRPVVAPVYNTKNSGDAILELAGLINGIDSAAFPWKGYDEVVKARARGLFEAKGLIGSKGAAPGSFDDMWESLNEGEFWRKPFKVAGNPIKGLFMTRSGRFEFFSSALEERLSSGNGQLCMPHYDAGSSAEKGEDADLRLIPYDMINLASGWIASPPYLFKTLLDNQLRKEDCFVEINPGTAGKLKLRQGDRITLKTQSGSAHARVNLFEGAMPGYVYLSTGFGHTGYDEFIRDKGINVNELIHPGKDPLSGHPAWWDTPVKITKA